MKVNVEPVWSGAKWAGAWQISFIHNGKHIRYTEYSKVSYNWDRAVAGRVLDELELCGIPRKSVKFDHA